MLKKILVGSALLGVLSFTAAPVVLAQTVSEPQALAGKCTLRHDFSGWKNIKCPGAGSECKFSDKDNDCAACCTMDAIYTATDWIFYGVVAFVIIFILLGAYMLLTSAGAPEKTEKGRNYIMWAGIGVLVALLAKVVPVIVKNLLRLG